MGIGISELIVILIVVLILFGPGKLPEVGKALGQAIREFKRAQRDFMSDAPLPPEPPPPATGPTSAPTAGSTTPTAATPPAGPDRDSPPPQS